MAIFFLLLFGFNTLGYYLYTTIAIMRANKYLEARLDIGDYSESNLIKINVPLSLPYTTDWTAPERVDGSITYQGVLYKYVKRIFTNGVMSYWCIAHDAGKHISDKATDYFGKVNGLPGTNSQKKNTDIKKVFSDFDQDGLLEYHAFLSTNTPALTLSAKRLNKGFIHQLYRPPII